MNNNSPLYLVNNTVLSMYEINDIYYKGISNKLLKNIKGDISQSFTIII